MDTGTTKEYFSSGPHVNQCREQEGPAQGAGGNKLGTEENWGQKGFKKRKGKKNDRVTVEFVVVLVSYTPVLCPCVSPIFSLCNFFIDTGPHLF